jgi:hypothetical protein
MEHSSQTKTCQNKDKSKYCMGEFTITPDDFLFYEKMKVPPPTFCPECRYIRRLLDRNEYNLYKRKCDATGENIISIYKQDSPFPVYKQDYWKSDLWDAMDYNKDFDFSRSFFEQYEELRRSVPHLAMVNSSSENSEYTNQAQNNRDCYMLVTSGTNEKCMYGSWNQNGNYMNSDCYMVEMSEYCYECIWLSKCSKCTWSFNCHDCVDVHFSRDCRGCMDCFGCVGLRNKQYYYFNENVGKSKYEELTNKNTWSREFLKEVKKNSEDFHLSKPVKHYNGFSINNSTGDYIQNTERTRYSFNCRDTKDVAYMQDAWTKTADCLDCTEIIKAELSYEIQGVEAPSRCIGIRSCFNTVSDSCYCDMCFGIYECFGCFGLKNKQYCILNKQYTKEKYFELKEKIIKHMRQTNEWGEYFPSEFSPFSYNESMAQDYFPLKKEEALRFGYKWSDRNERDYKVTIISSGLPQKISEVSDSILNEVIGCLTQENMELKNEYTLCTTAFKITKLELMLYKLLKIPLPEKCFPCRRQDRFKKRNLRKLYNRSCMKEGCTNTFETTYAPDRPEIVYCEECYKREIY